MVIQRTLVVLVGFGMLALGLLSFPALQFSTRLDAQRSTGPVQANQRTYIVQSQPNQQMYVAIGDSRKGSAGRFERAVGRVEVPFDLVDRLTVYRMEPAFICEDGKCRPCEPNPTQACPFPPPPPPIAPVPLPSGYVGIVFQASTKPAGPSR